MATIAAAVATIETSAEDNCAETEPAHRNQHAMANDQCEDKGGNEAVVGEDALQHEHRGHRCGYQ